MLKTGLSFAEGRGGAARSPRLPLSVKLILLTVCLPEGTSLFLMGLRLTLTRVIFIALVPVVLMRILRRIAAGRYRFVASDLFVPLAAFWMFLGPAVTNGLMDTAVHSGPVVLEYLMAYMSVRFLLSGDQTSLVFTRFLCGVLSVVALVGLLDTATGRFFTRGFVDSITGYSMASAGSEPGLHRFGLVRATGPLEHPILFGFACAIGFLLALSVDMRWQKFCVTACGIGLISSLSSAPGLAAVTGVGLILYSRLFVRVRHKWGLFALPSALVIGVFFLLSATPVRDLINAFTLDPQTGFYRLYEWQSVGPAILQNPYFAVLPGDYTYHGSIDSLWLLLALSYGIPCSVLTGLSLIGACSLPTSGRRTRLTKVEERLGTALGIVMVVIVFMGFTVDFWGSTWILVGLLVGLRANLGELGRLNLDQHRQRTLAPAL